MADGLEDSRGDLIVIGVGRQVPVVQHRQPQGFVLNHPERVARDQRPARRLG